MYPDETALIELLPSKGIRKEITWRDFDENVTRFANALMDRGIGKGDKVIHWMMNSINWLEAYFGIMRTGAWVVPLNFRFNNQDLKYCADVAEAKAMILGEEFTEKVEATRDKLPTVKNYFFAGKTAPEGMESFEDIITKASAKPVDLELSDEDEAALYFTSGTTGQPKPILLTHKNLGCSCIMENYRQGMKHDDNILLISPFYHTGTKMHWFGCLIVGARGTIMPEFSPHNVFQAVQDARVTVVFLLVPWMMDSLVALDKGELKTTDYDLSSVRLYFSGAQPVPSSVIKQWKKYFPVPFQICYGLGEGSGPGIIYYDEECPEGSLGRVGFNWEARVVDDNDEVLPAGKVGELCVKGDGVMKAYYKNPELTAATIKKGWLHTGDMVKMDSDGFLFLVDRKKDVIIYGGENVYPSEIEGVLLHHSKIYDVAVIGILDDRLGEIPAAVIDPKPGMTLKEEEVFKFCDEKNLPRYRRPRRIIFDTVPRNPTGKIEKLKLREKYSGLK
jgi:acyl-CoA synthetase (AMP-forming)/AMP-acid ligase II